MPDHDDTDDDNDVEVAQQLEQAAQQLVDDGRGSAELTMALDQLRADRANGEPLTTAVRRLRAAVDDGPSESMSAERGTQE